MLIAVGHLVVKYILDPSLLFEISNRFEEAVLTEMQLITLTIVLSTITPARLKTSVLKTTTFMQSGAIAYITQNIGDGLNFDTPTNLHRCSPKKIFTAYCLRLHLSVMRSLIPFLSLTPFLVKIANDLSQPKPPLKVVNVDI